jgi:hypothetical protein
MTFFGFNETVKAAFDAVEMVDIWVLLGLFLIILVLIWWGIPK